MERSVSSKRSWLAAVLAALVPGLGHCYLRRWRRALGWILAFAAVAAFLVDPATLAALANWESVDPLAVLPLGAVGLLSVLDAYLLAVAQNALARVADRTDGTPTACPSCGGELDPTLEFCHWCSEPIQRAPDDGSAGTAERQT